MVSSVLLRAAVRDAEARHHLVEDQHGALPAARTHRGAGLTIASSMRRVGTLVRAPAAVRGPHVLQAGAGARRRGAAAARRR